MDTGLSQRAGVVELPSSKINDAGAVVAPPLLQGRPLQLAEVPASVVREDTLEEAVPQGGVALGVGFSGVPLPHEAVEPQVVSVGAFHVEVHRQQVQHGGREGFLGFADRHAGDHLPPGLGVHLQAAYPVDDVPGLADHHRHSAPDTALQGFCKLLDVGVEAPVIELRQLHHVHPPEGVDAREGGGGVWLDVRELPGHGLDVRFIQPALDDRAGVLLLEVVRGPVEQDVHGPALSQGLPADVLHRDMLEAHPGGYKVPLVSAEDFPALVGVDRQQEAQLAERQLREGQALFIIPPGVVL